MVVASPLNLKKVTTSVNDSQKKVTEARSSVKNIGQVLFRRTKVKREAFAQTNLFRKRREENERRQTLEDELKAPSVVVRPGGPQQLTQTAGVGGFFDRILGFIGYLSAGWIMNNLPTWIAMGKEFIVRLQRAGEIVSGFFNNTVKLFVNVGNILGALGQNLMQFDFFDTSNRVKTAMSDLNFTMGNLTGQIEEAFSLLTTPLTEGKYSGEQIPGVGTQYQDEGAYAEPPPYSGGGLPDSKSAEMYRIAAALTTEGRAGQSAVDIMQVVVNRKATGRYGNTYTEIFARPGQFAGVTQASNGASFKKIQTLRDAAKWSGQSEATLLGIIRDIQNPSMQAAAARHVKGALEFRAAPQYYLKNGLVRGEMGQDGRFYNSSWRGSPGDNQFLQQAGKDPMISGAASFNLPAPVQQNQPSVSRMPGKTPGYSQAVAFGKSLLARGYKNIWQHPDFNWSRGYTGSGKERVAPRAYNSYHNYGEALDISAYNGEGKLDALYVELNKNRAKYGIAEILWRSPGHYDHLHIAFNKLGSTLTSGAPTQSTTSTIPAQIAAPTQQSNMVPFSLTPERRGQDVMVVLPQQQQNIITPTSGGGDMGPSPISDFELLNNFIKNKLLLDLAYL